MKKILLLLGAIGLTSTSILPVINCSSTPTTLSEEEIYQIISEIAQEPLEYNDEFLINYESPEATDAVLHALFSMMEDYYFTSTNLLSKLITKLVYEKVLTKIPNIKKVYPNFTLKAEMNNKGGNLDEEFNNLKNNQKFSTCYSIFYNLHSLDEIKNFTNFFGDKINSDNSNFIHFFGGHFSILSRKRIAEYFIEQVPIQKFYFKQSNFIKDDQKRLDAFLDLYQYGGNIKPFANDETNNTLNMFDVVQLAVEKNNLPIDVVNQIKNNNPNKEDYLKTIESFVEQWIKHFHLTRLTFDKLDLIDDFLITLNLENIYTKEDIATNKKLNYVFGIIKEDQINNKLGFDRGLLIYDLTLQPKYKNKISTKTHHEKLYIRISKDYQEWDWNRLYFVPK